MCDYTLNICIHYLTDHLWEFDQIYEIDAVGDTDELSRFQGQKVKGEGDSETKCSQICPLGGIFSPVSKNVDVFPPLLITRST